MPNLEKKLEEFRSEYEVLLNVLKARVTTAKDYEEWSIIIDQTKDILRIARSARLISKP